MNQIMPKGLDALLNDDPSLEKKITYVDYQKGKSVPDNSDHKIEEVYEEYRSFLEKEPTE